jgi:uncharacterized membrane protein YbjE (DUF340 family)
MVNPSKTPSDKKRKLTQIDNYLKFSGLAFQMIFVMGLAAWGGHTLDKYLEFTIPVFAIIFIILSLIGILYSLIKYLNSKKP